MTESSDEEDEFNRMEEERLRKERVVFPMFCIFLLELSHNKYWQYIILIGVFCTIIVQIYVVAYYTSFPGYFIFRLVMDTFYALDVILSALFILTYKSIKSDYKPKKLGFMILDVLTLLSFDYFFDFDGRKFHPVYIIMQILLFIRSYKIVLYAVRSNQRVGYTSALEVLLKLGSVIYLTQHLLACICIGVCGFNDASWTLGLQDKHIVIQSAADKFIVSMYFAAMYLCSTGYGDLVAITTTERIFVMFTSIVGIILLGVAVAALTSYHIDASQHNFEFSSHLSLIQTDLVEKHIPRKIREKILDYYQNLWVYKNGVLTSSFFERLPVNIRNAAYTDQYWDALETSTILRDLDLPSKRALASKMRSQLYVKGDVIVRQGELRTRMLYIIRGIVKVLSSEDTESTIMLLSDGSLICEVSLILSTPSPVQLEAGSLCEIQILDRANLYSTAMTYTQIYNEINKTFIEQWADAIQHEKKYRDEEDLSKLLGAPKPLRINLKNVGENSESERPYTWLHEDEMAHLITSSKTINKTFNVYVFCEVTTQTSDEICARTKFPFVFQPGTSLLLLWDFTVVVAAIVATVLYPMNVATREHNYNIEKLLIDFIYIVDFFISIFTAPDHRGEPLVTIGDILSYRLTHTKTLLVIICDALCVIPFSYFYTGKSSTIFFILQQNRLLKIWKVYRFFYQVENKYMENIAFIRSASCFVWISILSFWLGSFYFAQACHEGDCRDASWYTKELVLDVENRHTLTRHTYNVLLVMYLGIGIVGSTGIEELQGSTLMEFIYVIVLSLCCLFVSSYFIGSYNAVLQLAGNSEKTFQELVFVIKRFMEDNNLINSINTRVVRYLKLQWQRRQGYYILNNRPLYFDTPEHLQREMLIATRRELLVSIPLFEDAESVLINYIASHAESYMLPPEEIVIYSGEPCYEFYIVEEGYCEKFSGISGDFECLLGPKCYFCVAEVLFGIPQASEIRTATHVRLLRITKMLLQNALGHAPFISKDLTTVLREFKDTDALSEIIPREKKVFDEKPNTRRTQSWIIFNKKHEEYTRPFQNDWTRWISVFLLPRTITPNGNFLKIWEAFRICTIIVAGFIFPTYSYIWLDVPQLFYLRYFLDLVSIVDMYLLMHVCYYTEEGVLVSHPKATLKNYLTHNFTIDFIVLFPFDILTQWNELENGYYMINHLESFVYFLRLLSFYRLLSLKKFIEVGEIEAYKKWIEDLLFFVTTVVILNTTACVLVILSSNIIFKKGGSEYKILYPEAVWVNTKVFNNQSIVTVQLMALYWTICTAFCVAFGDITPLNSSEMLFIVVVFLIGYVFGTYMMVRITSRISGLGIYYSEYLENMRQMIEFFQKKRVTQNMQTEIVEHFEHMWKVTNSLQPQSIFCKFHSSLQEDTVVFLYVPTFKKCRIFHSMDYSFYRQLGISVQEEYYKEEAIIFRLNDIVSDVFFVHKGIIAMTDAVGTSVSYLTKGSFFGNIDDCTSVRVTCTARALTHVVLLKHESTRFYTLLKDFEYIKKHLSHLVADNKMYVIAEPDLEKEEMSLAKMVASAKSAKVSQRSCGNKMKSFALQMCKQASKFLVLCAAASIVIITYHAAFQNHTISVFIAENVLTLIFSIYFVVNVPWWKDWHTKNKTKSVKIKILLKKKEFWLDLFSFLPLCGLCFLIPVPFEMQAELWSYVSFSYLTRVYHIVVYFSAAHKYEMFNKKTMKYNIVELFIITTVLLHLTCCLMYVVDCFKNKCNSDKWAYQASDDEPPNEFCSDVYVCALYWAIEVYCGTGVGDIVPDTLTDTILLDVLIIFSKFVVCNLIGNLAAIVAEHLFIESKYNYEMPILKKYLRCCNLSNPLIKYIEDYAEKLWKYQNGKQTPIFFDKIPKYLKISLMNDIFGYHLHNNIIFSDCHHDFLRQLILHLEYKHYFAGNIIVNTGEINGTMYFVEQGQVEVLSVEGSEVIITDLLTVGDMFGMIQGLYKSTPHTRTFRAVTIVEILSLEYDKWKFLLPFFPQTHKELYQRASLFSYIP